MCAKIAKKDAKAKTTKHKDVSLNFFMLELDNATKPELNATKIREKFKSPGTFRVLRKEDESTISLLGKGLKTHPNELIFGTFIHNQKNDIPFSFDDDSQSASELPIPDNAGLGHQTSFLLDPEINVVMIESIRGGATIGDFCQFFEMNLNLTSLDASLVINPSEIERVYSLTSISKFEVKIARLRGASPFKDKEFSAREIGKIADATNTDTLDMTLSVGYGKGETLSLETIKKYIGDILKFKDKDNKDVKKLKVTGKTGAFTDHIDLIKERLKDNIKVELVRKNNITSTEEKYRALTSTYFEHKQSLHKAYLIDKQE